MKKMLTVGLIGCALFIRCGSLVYAVDASLDLYAFQVGENGEQYVNAIYSDNDNAHELCGPGDLGAGVTAYFYQYQVALNGGSGWSATNVAVICAIGNTPFTNCVTNCGDSFVANNIFFVYSNTAVPGEILAQPIVGSTNGIVDFTFIATNGVCFLKNGGFIVGGSFDHPGGRGNCKNLGQCNAQGVFQDITFEALEGVVQALTYDESTGDVLVQGTFTEVEDSVNGLITGVDGSTGIYWNPTSETFVLP
jgi:hypothetical protein